MLVTETASGSSDMLILGFSLWSYYSVQQESYQKGQATAKKVQ